MQFVLYLFVLSATFYLVAGACSSNTWPSELKCKHYNRGPRPTGTKIDCSCKSNCFPVTFSCNRNGSWVRADIKNYNACDDAPPMFIAVGKWTPGLMALYTGHKVKFDCDDGELELKGTNVALCEKGRLHMDKWPKCVRKRRVPPVDYFEGSGSGSGDSPRNDDEDDE